MEKMKDAFGNVIKVTSDYSDWIKTTYPSRTDTLQSEHWDMITHHTKRLIDLSNSLLDLHKKVELYQQGDHQKD